MWSLYAKVMCVLFFKAMCLHRHSMNCDAKHESPWRVCLFVLWLFFVARWCVDCCQFFAFGCAFRGTGYSVAVLQSSVPRPSEPCVHQSIFERTDFEFKTFFLGFVHEVLRSKEVMVLVWWRLNSMACFRATHTTIIERTSRLVSSLAFLFICFVLEFRHRNVFAVVWMLTWVLSILASVWFVLFSLSFWFHLLFLSMFLKFWVSFSHL